MKYKPEKKVLIKRKRLNVPYMLVVFAVVIFLCSLVIGGMAFFASDDGEVIDIKWRALAVFIGVIVATIMMICLHESFDFYEDYSEEIRYTEAI